MGKGGVFVILNGRKMAIILAWPAIRLVTIKTSPISIMEAIT
jgi:hypothetical protein